MKHGFSKLLVGAALLCSSSFAQAQGLEDIIVEEYHTVTQADADAYNNDFGGGSFPLAAGMKVYRIYVDMLPNYKLNTVFGSPETFPGSGVSPNALDFSSTSSFWNDDNFGAEIPAQTRRFDEGTLFDSYITVNTTGTSGGAVGCGSAAQQFGVLRTADTDGDLTTCGVYPGFTGNDGNIPATGAALTYNIGGLINFDALTGTGNTFTVINDAWTTLPASQGVDPTGTNRVLIAQLTTAGTFSFHINVQLSDPNSVLETYVWNQAGPGEVVSPKLTYPQALPPDCLGVPGGPAQPGTPCDDLSACTTNDLYDANCNCVGTPVDPNDNNACTTDSCDPILGVINTPIDPNDGDPCTLDTCDPITGVSNVFQDADGDGTCDANDLCPGGPEPGTACDDLSACTTNDVIDANCNCVGTPVDPNDNNACTTDSCDPILGVINTPIDPNDGDPCTLDTCDPITGVSNVFQDADGDGTCDANDLCPGGPEPGTACDDGNAGTGPDTIGANCLCSGPPVGTDCEGVPGGPAVPGTPCDDLSACTTNDLYDANCNCVGTPVDPNDNNACTIDSCDPILGVINTPIDPNDGDPCTLDTCDPITGVSNVFQDADGDGTCDANDLCPGGPEPGTACDDGNAATGPDTIGANCLCSGPPVGTDCEGVPGGPAVPGTPCDDLSACTTNDLYDANCNCVGTPVDPNDNNACTTDSCDPILGVINTPIDPNDGDPCTLDTCDPITGVSNVFQDADGDGTCDANDLCPGSPEPGQGCDDGNPLTGPDLVDANCNCVGDPIGPCTELLTLDITLDNFGSETTWEVYDETGTTLIVAGGPYSDGVGGTVITENICLNQLCYRLVVNDDGNNGISGGGYVLRDPLGRRIIDADGQFASTSSNILPFCLPLSANKLINSWCDKTDLVYAYSTQIYASNNPAASGYQFWMADPHGTYSRRVFKSTQNLQPTNLVNFPPPADLDLNVRVRALVNGVYTPFGPACIIRLNTPGGGNGRGTILFDEANAISLSLYPNPNRGEQLFIALGGVQADTKVELDVMDLFGKRVFADQFAAPSEEFVHGMDLNNLASGVYLVNVRVGDRLYTERLVKQ